MIWFGKMRDEDSVSRLFDVPATEIVEQIDAIDSVAKEAELIAIRERSLALGAIINKLALNRADLTESEISEGQMLDVVGRLIGELGLSELITIKGGSYIEISAQVMQELAQRLRAHRKELGLTQAEFGAQYGVSRFTVIRAEQGISTDKLTAKVFPDET
jgi:DNA-binding XRE family transcriptional regulator